MYKGLITQKFAKFKTDLIQELKDAQTICLTADHWSSYRKGYIGITCHWLHMDTMTMKHACLSLRRITGRCTYDVIAANISEVISEYGIVSRVSHCITDSGSNFIKAFREYAEIEEVGDVESDEVMQPQILGDALDAVDADETTSAQFHLPPHLKCAAHRLNLVGSVDMEKALDNPNCKSIYRSLMGKLTAMWNRQNRSTITSDQIRSVLGGLFVIPVVTRWNSMYDALATVMRYIKKNENGMTSLFREVNGQAMTPQEKEFLTELVALMEPLAEALDILQGQKVLSAGYLIPTITTLIEHWMHQRDVVKPKYVVGVISNLIGSVKSRFEKEMSSEFFRVATAIHPEFKLLCFSEEEVLAVKESMRRILAQYSPETASTSALLNTEPTGDDNSHIIT